MKNRIATALMFTLPLSAIESAHSTEARGGTFEWNVTGFQLDGSERSAKLTFKATVNNRTGTPWHWAAFCVKAFDANGVQMHPNSAGCLLDLTVSRLQPEASVSWNLSQKISIGSDKARMLSIATYKIEFVNGGQDPPNVATIPGSCDSAWPHALQVFTATGFAPKSSDRAGGVMVLEWTKGRTDGSVARNEVKQLTLARGGFFTTWDGFRIDSATAIFAPVKDGCRAEITLGFAGFNDGMGKGWFALESNHSFEQALLKKISDRVK